ncbi:hypothetical protein GPX89_30685 [Nocardia sp. ET3-3]|uniref:Lipoprotein LpqN n=1 Tax=Nocardia terrae TaxID=2675851 RepID=A0A7K1V4P8_9NOCA|nr:LpqN/LpqT family lipoprotein [Nocardia terrae]MVU81594.1 hypothetical protein [Nocardia terrae]
MNEQATTIYAALNSIAHQPHRIVDPSIIPGRILIDLDPTVWAEFDGRDAGYLMVFAAENEPPQQFRTNLVVVLTRAIVNSGVDLFTTVIGHAFTEARGLPGWEEERVLTCLPEYRHSGWSIQSGTYRADDLTLYTVTRYAAYERGNIAYLLQVTGTTADRSRFGSLLDDIVYNTAFED